MGLTSLRLRDRLAGPKPPPAPPAQIRYEDHQLALQEVEQRLGRRILELEAELAALKAPKKSAADEPAPSSKPKASKPKGSSKASAKKSAADKPGKG